MSSYDNAYAELNKAQREAVDSIDGPVLVIAGPGTGKTHLLTTRIAHILAKTDSLAENILCLTFTESAAQTMSERLINLIGQTAYNVTISTYHAFGSDLVRRYPEYFPQINDMQPVDELGSDIIFREIIDGLAYSNPLKSSWLYLNDLKTFVSDSKRALLKPTDLRQVMNHNQAFMEQTNPIVAVILSGVNRIDKKTVPAFRRLLTKLGKSHLLPNLALPESIVPLNQLLSDELNQALNEVETTDKTSALTAWKNRWLARDANGQFIIAGQQTNRILSAATEVYQQYLTQLKDRKLFDYDDMIINAVSALKDQLDFRYTLQERYQYIMLDEFQDTNAAQFKLIELLSDNPVNEGRPNILAVGDDDQAIYAFQGAHYSHMLTFQRLYRDVKLILLQENYRSSSDILDLAQAVSVQIEERLEDYLPQIEKRLIAAGKSKTSKKTVVERREAPSDLAQFAWTAKRIKQLITSGLPANEIAVLAPQHKYLEALIAFLKQQDIAIHYERRENILDAPAIQQLVIMSKLCLALANGEQAIANNLWAQVLSFDFWQLATSLVWEIAWQAHDKKDPFWQDILLKNAKTRDIALFFIRLSLRITTDSLEQILDYLIGRQAIDLREPGYGLYHSPFYDYYFSDQAQAERFGTFWHLLSNLTVLRSNLRDYQNDNLSQLTLADFVGFVSAYQQANIKLLNTNPHLDSSEAVQLMTAFKAKGQEFEAVFVLACNDEVWGSRARNQGAQLAIPPNLQFIRYAGATIDERLRLFFVALTRARSQLYLMSYANSFSGKPTTRLQFLNETMDETGNIISPFLPSSSNHVLLADTGEPLEINDLTAFWQTRHSDSLNKDDLRSILQPRLKRFQLSPTNINSFVDLPQGGPAQFFMSNLLRFPRAPTPGEQYGSAIHETLEWLHLYYRHHSKLPNQKLIFSQFDQRLRLKRLSSHETSLLLDRGHASLAVYVQQRRQTISTNYQVEYNFRDQGTFIGKAHMSGKVDKLIFDQVNKTLTVVDYKTGKAYSRWQPTVRHHFYQQQLYLYKILVENSRAFANFKVVDAYLEFVDPDPEGAIQELHLNFEATEQARVAKLAEVVWEHIQALNMPDTSRYPLTLNGIKAFEQDLIEGKI